MLLSRCLGVPLFQRPPNDAGRFAAEHEVTSPEAACYAAAAHALNYKPTSQNSAAAAAETTKTAVAAVKASDKKKAAIPTKDGPNKKKSGGGGKPEDRKVDLKSNSGSGSGSSNNDADSKFSFFVKCVYSRGGKNI